MYQRLILISPRRQGYNTINPWLKSSQISRIGRISLLRRRGLPTEQNTKSDDPRAPRNQTKLSQIRAFLPSPEMSLGQQRVSIRPMAISNGRLASLIIISRKVAFFTSTDSISRPNSRTIMLSQMKATMCTTSTAIKLGTIMSITTPHTQTLSTCQGLK